MVDEPIAAWMMAEDIKTRRAKMEFTVLTRGKGSDGVWHRSEVNRIVNGLSAELYTLPALPQHLILWGHFTKEQVLQAMDGGCTFTAMQVQGLENPELPFRPPIQGY